MTLNLEKPQKKSYFNNFIIALFLPIVMLISIPSYAESLVADGEGETPEDARQSALATLSQQVLVDVDSAVGSQVSVDNDLVVKSAQTSVQLESHIKFQGVVFKDAKRKKKIHYVRAVLSDAALRQTILYLADNLPDDIEGLTKLQISDSYHEVRQLIALLNFAAQKRLSVPNRNGIASKAADIEKKLQLRVGNYGWVRFIPPATVPFNDNFTITINEQNFAVASKIFLPVGSYRFEISRDNFVSETGILRISRSREERINLSLVRLPEEPLSVAISININGGASEQSKNIINRALKESLLAYQVKIDDASDLKLVVDADIQENNTVKDFEHVLVSLSITFNKSGQIIVTGSDNARLFNIEPDAVGAYQWQKLSQQTLLQLLAGDGLVRIAEGQ